MVGRANCVIALRSDGASLVLDISAGQLPAIVHWGADLEKLNGDPPFSLPMAATYVIGTDGTIIESFVDTDYTERMEPQAIIDTLRRRT